MAEALDKILSGIEARGIIKGHDIIDLRRTVFGDNFVARIEAERLFKLNNLSIRKPPAWNDFFVAAITSFLVRQSKPVGYVDDENARWFIEQVSGNGHIETETELRAVLSVLSEAQDSTERLVNFALAEVKAALIYGDGHIGHRRTLSPRVIGLDDIAMMETVLYASGGDGHIKVTEKEAETLFDINDVCEPEPNAAEAWQSLFVNAITNSVMFYSPYKNISREETKRQEDWLKSRGDLSLGNFATKITPQKLWDSFSGSGKKEQVKKLNLERRLTEESERIDESESLWLTRRISKDGVLNTNERALLRHLGKMCPDVHQSLKPFIKVAA